MNTRLFLSAAFCGLVALLSGCAGMKYDPSGADFSVTQESKNIFRSWVIAAYPWTSQQRVVDFAYLQAAEVTLNNGFKSFEVLSGSRGPVTSTYNAGAVGFGSATAYGGNLVGSGVAVPLTGHTSVPVGDLTILLFNEMPEKALPDRCYDAAKVKAELRKRYRISANADLSNLKVIKLYSEPTPPPWQELLDQTRRDMEASR